MWVCLHVKSEKGFTLIEMLITFSILLVILAIITPFIQVIFNSTTENNLHEWNVFVQQMKLEFREATIVTVSNENKILSFKNNQNQTIKYELYGTQLRRRVNDTGHEILIQNVKSISFDTEMNGVMVKLNTLENNSYQALITTFKKTQVN